MAERRDPVAQVCGAFPKFDRGLRVVLLAVFVGLSGGGCAYTPWQRPVQPAPTDDVYQHSTHTLNRPPESATACIVQNAASSGYAASVQPLYGTRAMAVSVRTLLAGGDTVATFSLRASGKGSEATMSTAQPSTRDRSALVETLLKDC